MRPLTLQVEGLRSFRDGGEPISFEDRDYLAIIGDTGAGKSSLLEAMGWALYGNTSWSGQPNQELMNATSTQTRVVLTFMLRGERWRVTRALRRREDGTVGPAKALLERLDPDDDEEVLESIDGVRNVNTRVVDLLGLSYEGFTRAVVLPQGRFAQLLVADDPRDRAEILKELWGVRELVAAKADADGALTQLVPTVEAVKATLADAPADPAAHLAELQAAATRARGAANEARARAERAAEALQTLNAAREQARQVSAARTGLQPDPAWAATAEALQARDTELVQAEAGVGAKVEATRGALAAVPGDDDGLGLEEVATATDRLERIALLPAAIAGQAEAARSAAETAATAEKQAKTKREAADAAAEAVSDHVERRGPLRQEDAEARSALEEAREALRRWRRVIEERDARHREHTDVQAQLPGLEQAVTDAQVALDAARREEEQAERALAKVQREHAAVSAAAGLQGGDPCTVCQRPLPEGWSVPTEPAHADAEDRVRRSRDATSAAQGTHITATAALDTARQNLQTMGLQVQQLDAQVESRATELVGALNGQGVDLDPRHEDEAILSALIDRCEEAATALTTHEQAAEQLQTTAAGQSDEATRAEAVAEARLRDADRERRAVHQQLADLRGELNGLPAALPVHAEFADDLLAAMPVTLQGLEETRALLDQRRETLQARHAERERCRTELERLEGDRRALQQRRDTEITQPLRELADHLDGHRRRLEHAATVLEADPVTLPNPLGLPAAELHAVVHRHRAQTDRLEDLAARTVERANQTAESAERSLDQLAEGLQGDAEDHDALVTVLEADARQLDVQASINERDAKAFELQVEPLQHLMAVAEDLRAKRLVLEDLSEALSPGAFPKWLTMRRSHDLLLHASGLLESMTAKRYSFAEVDDPEAPWKIVDNDTGLARTPASLSGGETFVASLALALGMVEMMARSGGRLESLWLDEGFGALDRSNLDAAVDALSQVATRGRMVAVISHVRAVAEQVEHVLAVTRSARGSTARWLSPAERAALVEADITIESDSMAAIEGLLD